MYENHPDFVNYLHINMPDLSYYNATLQHQLLRNIYKYSHIFNINLVNLKIFCVVRNPYDRIISDLFWLKKLIFIHLNTKFVMLLKNI